MGFQNDKSEIFDQMGVFKVMSGLKKPKIPNSFDSVNSKSKNLTPFMLDLLGSTCIDNATSFKDKERCSPSGILVDILTKNLPLLNQVIKEGIIKGLKAGLFCGTDFTIPSPTPTFTSDVNRVDFTDLMRTDPNSSSGSMLFDNANVDFNRFLYNVISSNGSGTWSSQNGINLLDASFNGTTQQLTITINASRAGTSFHQFLIDYMDSIVLFTEKTVTANIMNQSFGTLSADLNVSSDTLLNQAKMDMGVKKVLDVDVCADELILDDSFYTFSGDELLQMEEESRNKSRGVNVVDLGCGLVETTISPKLLSELPDLDTATPQEVKDIITNTLDNVGNAVGEFGSPEDAESMKANFNANIVIDLPKVLMQLVLTPKVIGLYQISHQTVNGSILNVDNGYDFSREARTFYETVVREASAAVLKIIYNKIKAELLKLVQRVVLKIIKEKIKLYTNAIKGILLSKIPSNPNQGFSV